MEKTTQNPYLKHGPNPSERKQSLKAAAARTAWMQQLALRVQRVEQRSMRAPEFEGYELHMVRWGATWGEALADLRATSPHIAEIISTTVIDDPALDDGAPLSSSGPGGAFVALPVDNAPSIDVYALYLAGWSVEEVTRIWPGGAGIAPTDHDTRAGRVAARARGSAWTYYRSLGIGFVYKRSAARARDVGVKSRRRGTKAG